MKQILIKSGEVFVEEVPAPTASPGTALVRMSHSLISAGTESELVAEGGATSFVLKKARDPLNLEKVKKKLATVGIRGTLETIRGKLAEYVVPGYSAAGVIVACGPDLRGYRVGDPVACAGVERASHAEYGVVPEPLLTPIPEGVSFEEAAFVALGAIAMHGVRQAAPSFGETFVVMGLGLVGQLAAQILRVAGCRVVCSDPLPERRALALECGADVVCAPDELPAQADFASAGYGVDGVLICAASRDSALANTAIQLCRRKGRVVVVGDVAMALDRPALYAKEIDFRLSCSYGPGRYDPRYEEAGCDYPIGYVRWTESRNMAEFLRMVAERKVRVTPLIAVVKPVSEAKQAYAAALDKDLSRVAVLIDYDLGKTPSVPSGHRLEIKARKAAQDSVGIAVIGAGNIAKGVHLPNLARIAGCHLEAVFDEKGPTAKEAGERFGARFCGTDYHEALADDRIRAVLIATRHDSHATIALDAIKAGKHVFVEKPLALTVEDCEAVCRAVAETGALLTVGFNRRFAPLVREAKNALPALIGPKTVLCRVNADPLPPGHWGADPKKSGGRMLGEAVHFFDLICWLLNQEPCAIHAERLGEGGDVVPEDSIAATFRFPDGSLAGVVYTCVGHGDIGKEYFEFFGGGAGIVLDDYRSLRFAGIPRKNRREGVPDKGQFGLLQNFVQAVRGEAELFVTATDGLRATRIAQDVLRRARGDRSGEARP